MKNERNSDSLKKSSYDNQIDRAKSARNTQRGDTDPRVVREGHLGVDDLDRLRRRNIK